MTLLRASDAAMIPVSRIGARSSSLALLPSIARSKRRARVAPPIRPPTSNTSTPNPREATLTAATKHTLDNTSTANSNGHLPARGVRAVPLRPKTLGPPDSMSLITPQVPTPRSADGPSMHLTAIKPV